VELTELVEHFGLQSGETRDRAAASQDGQVPADGGLGEDGEWLDIHGRLSNLIKGERRCFASQEQSEEDPARSLGT
jgi:hypothetical protein